MGKRCVGVPGCKSDSSKGDNEDRLIFIHSFPASSPMKRKWLAAIPRKGCEVSNNSYVCSLHFRDTDYICGSTDTNLWRKNLKESKLPDHKKLKPDSAPSVFPNLPSYLTKQEVISRPWNSEEKRFLAVYYFTRLKESFSGENVILAKNMDKPMPKKGRTGPKD